MSPIRKNADRTVALCYVRLSWTKDESDANSPDRQKANIQHMCDTYGWIPEWYEDTDGHRSGTQEKNRPGWLALKARLADPDIVALVANDLSRLHRKGWRVGDLLDFVDEHDVKLVLAAPGKQMDFSTPQGRLFAQLSAIFDEWYAVDVSQRYKDMITHRKRQGKTVGLPPFGTKRDKSTGYLYPSDEGAWFLPDGTFRKGTPDTPPHPDAVWRGYYETAHYALTLYSQNVKGIEAIAYQLQVEGWPWRDRQGNPSLMEGDDVRRIVANWAEYGGFVSQHRARERHPDDYPVDAITLDPERAVFDVDLLYQVGRVRAARTIKRTPNDGHKTKTYPYPLSGVTYCYHCEQRAKKHDDASLNSRLGGKDGDNNGRYRHKSGVKCGCTNRSVPREVIEGDVARLLRLLTVDTTEIDLMTELSVQSAQVEMTEAGEDLEAQKQTAIAKCQRRIDAARNLYADGDMSREEYLRRKEANEREIAHWEARTTETEKVALELTMCLQAIDKINQLWDISSDEDRQGMIRSLFSYITYNLDTQRIVDFRLKPWADRFITLRGALYMNDENSRGGKGVTPTGLRPIARSRVAA